MRIFSFVTLTLCLIGMLVTTVPSKIEAQASDEYWYFAWSPAEAQIVAYTLSGQTSIAAKNIDVMPTSAWRMDNKLVLVTKSDNSIYLLTPNSFAEIGVFGKKVTPLLYHYPYVVIGEAEEFQMPAYVLNLTTNATVYLTGYLDGFQPAIAFAKDGQLLRYWSRSDLSDLTWRLLEFDLQTQSEKTLFTTSVPGSFSQDGQFWIYHMNNDGQYYTNVYSSDAPEAASDYDALIGDNFAGIINQDLVIAPNVTLESPCSEDCPVNIYSLNGGEAIEVSLPRMSNFPHVTRIDETKVLVELFTNYETAEIEVWLADIDGQTQFLGACPLEIGQSCVSPDGQWVFTFTPDRTRYFLWNSSVGENVLQMEHDPAKTPSIAATFNGDVVA
ncbi:MAG: hypothetical protein K8L91_03810 [Anaerolineae bacterium]|nr:hypothetical protein [Anaerolineae bacterium]